MSPRRAFLAPAVASAAPLQAPDQPLIQRFKELPMSKRIAAPGA
jgi:hypothetical protein